jgi:hypothetical protein
MSSPILEFGLVFPRPSSPRLFGVAARSKGVMCSSNFFDVTCTDTRWLLGSKSTAHPTFRCLMSSPDLVTLNSCHDITTFLIAEVWAIRQQSRLSHSPRRHQRPRKAISFGIFKTALWQTLLMSNAMTSLWGLPWHSPPLSRSSSLYDVCTSLSAKLPLSYITDI